jgi:flagellar biosynthesis/type III secretory pathway chaperone
MTEDTLIGATDALCEVLEAENAALRQMDIKAANGLVDAKRIATDRLIAAQKAVSKSLPPELVPHVTRLRDLGQANRTLLENAIVAQDRVLACIARAIPKALAMETRYGAKGQEAKRHSTRPVALSARA